MNNLPDQMTAVVLTSYAGADGLVVEKRPVPKPEANQVLVKIAASPINPSDVALLEGRAYTGGKLPIIPGLEGSGTVVAAGSGLMARFLMGKRVALAGMGRFDGTWAEYMLTTANSAFPLDSDVELIHGAMSIVNPLTAYAFIRISKQGKHETIINTAAASSLGQMINRLAKDEGIRVVNIVRRDEQVTMLKQQGIEHVLNSEAPNFEDALHDICEKYDIRLALDAITGDMTEILLKAIRPRGKVIVYGSLAHETTKFSDIAMPLIYDDKSIEGYFLANWTAQMGFIQRLLMWRRVNKLVANTLKSEIRATYPLEDVRQAVKDYTSNMTGGKILLVPEA